MQLQHKYFYKRLRNKNSDNIDVTELLTELIYNRESKYLSYYVNDLINSKQVEEIFKVLYMAMHKHSRRDSRYDSDLENEDQHSLCESEYESDFDSAKETEQCSINKTIKTIIQTLINAGVNIGTYKYETSETPLHWASSVGNIEIVNFLIKKGVDVDIKNNRGATALHLAIINGHLDVVKKLIELRARINITDSQGKTPLQLAVSCEACDIVEYLLQVGANPNISCPFIDRSTDDIGELDYNLYTQAKELEGAKCSPLQLAAFLGNLDIIKLLITYGADVDAVCESKMYSCLHMAVFGITYCVNREIREELEVLNFLLSNSNSPNLINSRDHEGKTPLHMAVSANHKETIRVLLEYRASLLEFRKGGYTVFHDAVDKGNLDIVKLLLDNSDEQAKLINCVYIPVEENGDDICLQLSPLHVAISAYIYFLKRKEDSLESFNIIKYLLSYSTLDINIKNFDGETPLHYAIKYIEDDELALALINELLTAKNINLFIKDQTNRTPFDWAIENNRNKILQALIDNKYGSDKDSLLHLAAKNGDVKAVEYLIEKFDVNLQNDLEITPLQLAASKGSIDVVRVLIKKGAVDISAQPAAYRAIFEGNLDMADLLLTSFTNSKERVNYCFCMSMTTIEQIYACDSIDENKSQENVQAKQIHIDRLIRAICHLVNSYHELDINIFDDQKRTALHRVIKSKLDIDNKLKLLETLLKRKDINPFIKDAENKTPIDYYIEQENYSHPILDQYAKIQADRNTSIENYNAKKYFICATALCAVNVVFIEMYINQHLLESFIPDIQYLGLMFIINIVACVCCVIISKSIEKSIEEKYKNKVFGLFENNDEVSPKLEETNLVTLSSQRGECLIGG